LLAGGFILTACGCAALNFDAWILTLAAIFLFGIGIGLTIPAVNLLTVKLNQEKSSSALSTINFFWGFGAILCKPFVDLASSPESIFLPTFFLCFAFLLFSGAFLVSNFDEDFNQNEDSTDFVKPIWTTGTAWLITIFNFVHIGVESSVGGWITTYESRLALSGNRRLAFRRRCFFVLGRRTRRRAVIFSVFSVTTRFCFAV
jgi:FHS family glucose/mannose:H+ symporter-like MFS transporter